MVRVLRPGGQAGRPTAPARTPTTPIGPEGLQVVVAVAGKVDLPADEVMRKVVHVAGTIVFMSFDDGGIQLSAQADLASQLTTPLPATTGPQEGDQPPQVNQGSPAEPNALPHGAQPGESVVPATPVPNALPR